MSRTAVYFVIGLSLILVGCAPRRPATQSVPDIAPSPTTTAASPTATTAPPTFTAVPPTPTTRPASTLIPGALAIAYDEKVVSLSRQETLTYGFEGQADDDVTVQVVMSNARENVVVCQRRTEGSKSTFSVTTDDQQELEPSTAGDNPNIIRSYRLPYTGTYYIHMTCYGPGCNAFCVEQDLTLMKNP